MMTGKPPRWADLLLTVWVFLVGLFYFGAILGPAALTYWIGRWTGVAGLAYALMLMAAVLRLAIGMLARSRQANPDEGPI